MKKALLGMVLLAASAFAAPGISIGISVGTPAPVPMVRPACPGPGYVWVDGYYGYNHAWVPGFWRPPVVVVTPRYFGYGHRYDAPRNDFRRNDRWNDFRRGGHNFRQDFRR